MLKLRPYQQAGLDFLRANPRAFLADEMGLGKSAQMILASEGRTLIVAPAMVLDGGTWRDEIAKWCPDRAPEITCVPYTSLVQREGRKITRNARPEYRGPWDTVILDEAHYLKGRKTSWTVALRPILKRAGRVIYATGTPVPNRAQGRIPRGGGGAAARGRARRGGASSPPPGPRCPTGLRRSSRWCEGSAPTGPGQAGSSGRTGVGPRRGSTRSRRSWTGRASSSECQTGGAAWAGERGG